MLETLVQFFATKFLYLALHLESGSFPRTLSPQEEAAAFSAFRQGDLAARDTLIQHNLRLVAHIAKKYYSTGNEQDDLISIGTIGLIKAVNTFDVSRPSRFSTYASKCIENAIFSPTKQTGVSGWEVHTKNEAGTPFGNPSSLFRAVLRQPYFCLFVLFTRW